MANSELAGRLTDARRRTGLKSIDIARRLGVSKQLVSHWEHARTEIPTDKLVDLAGLLGVDIAWLITGQAPPHLPGAPVDDLTSLTALGRPTRIPRAPDAATLERVANPHPDSHYVARFTAPEFTSVCPVTGQPDFAHLVVDYVPAAWIVESKSLKLYLASYRNHAAFHEDCTISIAKSLLTLLEPHFLRIGGYWYPRGGIPIDIFWQTGQLPDGAWLPDQGVAPYRGRG